MVALHTSAIVVLPFTMEENNKLRLPIIDFSNKSSSSSPELWDSTKVQVRKALEEFGCFEALVDDEVRRVEIREEVVGALKEVFDLPLETKKLNVSEKPFHGYLGEHPERSPLYESIGIDDPNIVHNVECLSNTLWPQGNEAFRFYIFHVFNHIILNST